MRTPERLKDATKRPVAAPPTPNPTWQPRLRAAWARASVTVTDGGPSIDSDTTVGATAEMIPASRKKKGLREEAPTGTTALLASGPTNSGALRRIWLEV